MLLVSSLLAAEELCSFCGDLCNNDACAQTIFNKHICEWMAEDEDKIHSLGTTVM